MTECMCNTCKTGLKHSENESAIKKKEIKLSEFISREKVLGMNCILCIHNGTYIGKRKQKFYKKVYPSFQSIDLYEKIEE